MPSGRQPRVLWGLAVFACCLLAPAALGAGVVGSPHDFSDTVTTPQHPTRSSQIAPAGVCSACHLPHRADAYTLWARNLDLYRSNLVNDGSPSSVPNYVLPPTIQCYDCHDYHGGGGINNDPAITAFDGSHRPQNIAAGFTRNNDPGVYNSSNMTEDAWGGSESGYYENKPPGPTYGADPNLDPSNGQQLAKTGGHYFKHTDPDGGSATFAIGDKLPCRDCHDPHAWTGTWQAFIKPNLGGATGWSRITPSGSPTASRYMANDFTPSGGRNDADSRSLCIACHGNSDTLTSVNFSSISPAYSAGAIVRPPNSIAEHRDGSAVACVSCHNHNSIDASCSDCHAYPPSEPAPAASRYPSNFTPSPDPDADADPVTRGSHPKHTGAKAGEAPNSFSVYSFPCETCHYASAGTGSTMGYHGNDNVSVIVKGVYTKAGGTYDSTNYYNQAYYPAGPTGQLDNSTSSTGWGYTSPARSGWNSCQFVYCHSAGRVKSSMADNEYRRPQFNTGPLGCNGCHGDPALPSSDPAYGMPNYPNGGPGTDNANSHAVHVVGNGFECSVCHAGTATGSGAGRAIVTTTPTLHVDTQREVSFASGTYDNAAGVKTCSVSCHGAATPQWGGTLANGCFDCHSGTEQISKPQSSPGDPNPVDNNEYLSSGHGRTSGVYPGDNNLPAGFGNYTASPTDCFYCHSQNAGHTTKDANDPFRLGYGSDATGQKGYVKGAFADNTDVLCLRCHGVPDVSNPQRAMGTAAQNMQTHAHGITGTKYTWTSTPWKCVDCHDPHGDGKTGAERWMMLRSGINAPLNSGDGANAGSDAKSIPKRTTNISAIAFSSLAGFVAGSYAQSGNGAGGVWGPCEVCHTQTNTYSRTIDNDNTHATRTGRCTTCHPHNAGFAAKACKGCHGGDTGDPGQVSNDAPNITQWWTTSGHGQSFASRSALGPVQCEECHDVGYLSSSDHKTDGAAGSGPPPANVNTMTWPGKSLTANNQPTANTAHLKQAFFPSSPANKYDYARVFNRRCGDPAAGCHLAVPHNNHPQVPAGSVNPADNVMRFGDNNSVLDPKVYYWYAAYSDYRADFYKSRSPWEIEDLTTSASGVGSDNGVQYGTCATCHDPHGTDSPQNIAGGTTNRMLRGNSKSSGQFCNTACHTTRTPP